MPGTRKGGTINTWNAAIELLKTFSSIVEPQRYIARMSGNIEGTKSDDGIQFRLMAGMSDKIKVTEQTPDLWNM